MLVQGSLCPFRAAVERVMQTIAKTPSARFLVSPKARQFSLFNP